MSDSYNPTAITETDTLAIVARIARYVRRHGSEYGETPVPGGDHDEAVAVIIADWIGADWESLEWTFLQRNGRPLFSPDLSDMGRHMRAALFMAGRAKRRGWVESGPMRRAARAESRRRDMDDSTGASMASRAPDPARVAAAVEEAYGKGIMATPVDYLGQRLRWVKTRNSTRYVLSITAPAPAVITDDGRVTYREGAATGIRVEAVTVYNFRRAGKIPARELPKTRKRVARALWYPEELREAITG